MLLPQSRQGNLHSPKLAIFNKQTATDRKIRSRHTRKLYPKERIAIGFLRLQHDSRACCLELRVDLPPARECDGVGLDDGRDIRPARCVARASDGGLHPQPLQITPTLPPH